MLFQIVSTVNLIPLDRVEASTPDQAVALSKYGPSNVVAVAVDAPTLRMSTDSAAPDETNTYDALTNRRGVWNGFDAPIFPLEEAARIAQWVTEDPHSEMLLQWDEDRQGYAEFYPEGADTWTENTFYERVSTPYGHGYAIGAYAWTWQEVQEKERPEGLHLSAPFIWGNGYAQPMHLDLTPTATGFVNVALTLEDEQHMGNPFPAVELFTLAAKALVCAEERRISAADGDDITDESDASILARVRARTDPADIADFDAVGLAYMLVASTTD